jgi:hypothetical protein
MLRVLLSQKKNMPFLCRTFRAVAQKATFGVLLAVAMLSFGLAQPASAESSAAPRYIAADGSDLTAFAQCLPKELSQPSLKRALQESGNDFIEKVFNIKGDYREYKLDEAEVAHLNCMEQKGVTPQVER